MFEQDTIAAISTALSVGGIGIIRISGPDAIFIGSRIFVPAKKGKEVDKLPAYTAAYGYAAVYERKNLCNEINEKDLTSGQPNKIRKPDIIDECIALVMKSPKSYTGEDVVELSCHGGITVLKKVLESAFLAGARPAKPGEFTKRAFLNGRIDLSQAEAVMDVIHSKNEFALKNSVNQLKGGLREKIEKIRENILYQLAYIESALDDPEHISLDGYGNQLYDIIKKEKEEIDNLIQTAEDGKILKEGIRTAIVGKPNAGKSSLLNLLLGENRAIVTEVAGTTRDILEESVRINGIPLQLMDTAGIRKTDNIVEQIGIERAKDAMEEADLILYVADGSGPLTENDDEIMACLEGKNAIILLNKSDLKKVTSEEQIKARLKQKVIVFSVKDKTGLDKLHEEISRMFFHGKLSFNDEIYITNMRQKQSLVKASESLSMVLSSIEDHMPEDFYSIDLTDAYENLGAILGESMEEDLVNKIFKEFCIGK